MTGAAPETPATQGQAAYACDCDCHAIIAAQAAIAARQPQPAPGYVTVDARDIAIALNGYAGFTGDPVSFASELHERLRRTVFADDEQPAPELAAAKASLARVLSWFPTTGTRNEATATRAQLAHAYQDGGLDVPDELRRFL